MKSENEQNEDLQFRPGNVSSSIGELEPARRPTKPKLRKQATGLEDFYGSLRKESVEGKLFELDTFASILKKQALYYFGFVIICSFFWPILGLAIPWVRNQQGDSKIMKMFLIILLLSVISGIALWCVPVIFLAAGGWDHFFTLLTRNEISVLDFYSCLTDQVLLLLAFVFSWIFHELTLDLRSIKERVLGQMRGTDWGTVVVVEEEQVETIKRASDEAVFSARSSIVKNNKQASESPPTSPHLPSSPRHDVFNVDESSLVPLYGVMSVLEESIPGWSSGADEVTDYIAERLGEPYMFKDMLQRAHPQSVAKGLTALDVFLTREQWLMHESLTGMDGLVIVWKQTKDWLFLSREVVRTNPTWIAMVFVLALVRMTIPRLWLKFVLDGYLLPRDVGALCVVASSGLATLATTLYWLMLFMTVMLEYRRNVCQAMILGAMVEPRLRVQYVEKYLMNSFEFDYTAEQAEEVLSMLPILSLTHSTNVAAFWKMRDYVVLDRSNERMAMAVFLEMLVLWLLIKFGMTVITTIALAKFTPFLVVTLFDVVIFGAFLVYSLSLALNINDLTDCHRRVLVETRQRLVLDMAKADFTAKGKDLSPYRQNLRDTRRLLQECEEIIKECDHRDRLLLGMDVTPGKVVSVFVSIVGAVFTLIQQMIHNGAVERPKGFDKNVLLLSAAHHLFGHHVSYNPWSTWSTITSDASLQLQSWGQ